jgi:3-hydroxyacyl-CoA dehydrogenase
MADVTKKVVVLGAGMVGAAIARDLSDDAGLRVDVADVRSESLERVAERARVGKVRRPRQPRAYAAWSGTTSWSGLSPASSASRPCAR